jgi:hypothetical protein
VSTREIGENPYYFGGPIRDPERFFGREKELRIVFERIGKGGSTALVGQRLVGKTSFLCQVTNQAIQACYLPPDHPYVFVCLAPELGIKGPDDFFRQVFQEVARQETAFGFPSDGRTTEPQVRGYLEALASKKLVLLLDEFEEIIKGGHFPVDFFRFLRGLASWHAVTFVTATKKDLWACSPPEVVSSPFPNIFQTVQLGSFTPAEFETFIATTSRRSGVSLEAHQADIKVLAGWFPFFVQLTCWHYYEAARANAGQVPDDRTLIYQRFEDDARPHFARIWETYLEPKERETVLALVKGEKSVSPRVTRALERKGYVVDGRIFSSAFAEYIIQSPPPPPPPEKTPPVEDDKSSAGEGRKGTPLYFLLGDLIFGAMIFIVIWVWQGSNFTTLFQGSRLPLPIAKIATFNITILLVAILNFLLYHLDKLEQKLRVKLDEESVWTVLLSLLFVILKWTAEQISIPKWMFYVSNVVGVSSLLVCFALFFFLSEPSLVSPMPTPVLPTATSTPPKVTPMPPATPALVTPPPASAAHYADCTLQLQPAFRDLAPASRQFSAPSIVTYVPAAVK